jgi:hypothetical protein
MPAPTNHVTLGVRRRGITVYTETTTVYKQTTTVYTQTTTVYTQTTTVYTQTTTVCTHTATVHKQTTTDTRQTHGRIHTDRQRHRHTQAGTRETDWDLGCWDERAKRGLGFRV